MHWNRTKTATLLVGLGLLATVAQAGLPARLRVEVKEGQLRQSPSFLGRIVARVPFGTPVGVVREQGAWVEVSAGQDHGWLHATALQGGGSALSAGGAVGSSATSDEVALAGKGFDQAVEDTFRRQNPTLEFKVIDRMASFQVTPEEMRLFLSQGELPMASGGGE
jgi:hypothetical protein